MTEQHKVITTGELNASIEGVGEFATKEVEFIGSDDGPDFILQGTNSERGFIFYLPKYESGKYSLHPGSVAKAFYAVEGRLYGEVEEGSIEVTVTKPETVVIAFDISIKESFGDKIIRLAGSGAFKGRAPWTNRHRELLNIAQGAAPLWFEGPDIIQPKPGVVPRGFQILGRTGIANPDDWELEILIGSTVVHRNRGQSGREFSYYVPADLIPQGTGFYFRLDYYIYPFWSRWTYSGDLVMANTPSPKILKPVDNEIFPITNPEVSGSGEPGFNLILQTADHSRVVGQTTVGQDGVWRATLGNVSSFPVAITAKQTLRQLASGWSEIVNIHYLYSELGKPIILTPAPNAFVRRTQVEVSGSNCIPNADVNLYKAGEGTVLYGTAKVRADGTWTIKGNDRMHIGPFGLTVQQVFDGKLSEYATAVNIILIL